MRLDVCFATSHAQAAFVVLALWQLPISQALRSNAESSARGAVLKTRSHLEMFCAGSQCGQVLPRAFGRAVEE